MLASSIPSKIQLPFANTGTKNTIPVPSQISITPGAASYTDGFPPLTFTPLASGGIPPDGADMNGVLNAITAVQQWQSAGGNFKYDSAFSTAIGGYPAGSVLISSDGFTQWLNLSDNNTTDPDGGSSANWAPIASYGITAVTGLTNTNVTLSATQFKNKIITLSGTLTGNVQIIFPTLKSGWKIYNNTTGSFTITAKTAAGTGPVIVQGSMLDVYGDGTNILDSGLISQGTGDSRYGGAMSPFNVTQAANLLTGTLGACKVDFRNTALATGTPIEYNVASPLSLSMTNIAASLGATTGVQTRLAYALVYGAGTPQIAVANTSGGLQIDESNLITTSSIGAGSTSDATWYSTSAIGTPSPYKIIGICDATWTTGVGWGSPTLVQPAGSIAIDTFGGFGFGQTEQDVTGLRTSGTTYYNPTAKPIWVTASFNSTASGSPSFSYSTNGMSTSSVYYANSAGYINTVSFMVRPFRSYVMTATSLCTLSKVVETR